jgi:cytochrome c oxidase assembly protein subunit 15
MTHRLGCGARDPRAAAAGLATQTPWFVAARRLVLALGVQISLGISNVVFHLPLVAVAHNLGGAALLLTLV